MIELFITTFNRKRITQRCLELLEEFNVAKYADIHIHDDGSTEYNLEWLKQFSHSKITSSKKVGIDEIMLNKIVQFKRQSKYDFFYSYDNDILHDPTFFKKLEELYDRYRLPVTLYNSKYNKKRIRGEKEDVFFLRSFPGASIYLNREDISFLNTEAILKMTCTGWDWHFAYILNKRFVCPKISYCDHYPEGGIHSKRDDVALNPTDFLKEERRKFYE
jgi:hypothetical protein